jgi:hypothetical protein
MISSFVLSPRLPAAAGRRQQGRLHAHSLPPLPHGLGRDGAAHLARSSSALSAAATAAIAIRVNSSPAACILARHIFSPARSVAHDETWL